MMLHTVFFAITFLYILHITMAPEVVMYPSFLAATSSSFFFLLPALFQGTSGDFATPKSASFHAYLTFLVTIQVILFVYLNTQPLTHTLPYSALAHGTLIAILLLITLILYIKVDNRDKNDKRIFVRGFQQVCVFLVLFSFCYAHVLTGALLEKKYAGWFQQTYNESKYLSYSTMYSWLKFSAQLGMLIGWLGTVIASGIFLKHQITQVNTSS